MNKRKAVCTPEEWAAHLAQARAYADRPGNREKINARQRAYNNRPEIKEYTRERNARSEVRAKRRAWRTSDKTKAREHERRSRPEVKARGCERYRQPEIKAKVKAYNRERKSGMTADMVARLLVVQGGCCSVCRAPFELRGPRRINADHCHDSKTPRGLLCMACNSAEGFIKRTGLTPEEFGTRLQHYVDNPPIRQLDNSDTV